MAISNNSHERNDYYMKNLMQGLMWFRATVPKLVPDALAVVGAVVITYGVALIYPPAGWIAGGILLVVAAVIWSKGGGAE